MYHRQHEILIQSKIYNYHKWHFKLFLLFKSQQMQCCICSVSMMMFISIVVLASISTTAKCLALPDPNFVADIATNFNRLGIIYHLPLMAKSDVWRYYKTISKFRWFVIDKAVQGHLMEGQLKGVFCKSETSRDRKNLF